MFFEGDGAEVAQAQPILIAQTAGEQTDALRQYAEDSSAITWFVRDFCRMKEDEADPYFTSPGLSGQDYDDQWAVKRVGFTGGILNALSADEAGDDIIVAVIDTGIDWYHPDLDTGTLRVNTGEIPRNGTDDDGNGYVDDRIGWNFVEQTNSPWDYDGHGTFVAGVIAEAHGNGFGMTGIKPKARIVILKALGSFGQGCSSIASEAVAYAADNGARIFNLSLGGRGLSRLEELAIQHATHKGVLVVVAAGNSATDVAAYGPSGLPGVITVEQGGQRGLSHQRTP
ncbi:MAG: S8 family serine peptidase [Pseudomonadota bacterium]